MADRIKGLNVALTHDVRDDDCQEIINAMLMIKGVSVVSSHITDTSDYLARKHVKSEIREAIHKLYTDLL